jgi:predicted component of type VI protein secretion system
MAILTLSVLEGLERGLVYQDLETPVTIGREEDNVIQLNDERVSRVHAKLQEDRSQVILTDLNSTNGSRVNGHPVQLRVLQPGDHVQIGRCTLLFGSNAQIAEHAQRIGVEVAALTPLNYSNDRVVAASSDSDSEVEFQIVEDPSPENLQLPLFPGGAPVLPEHLQPGQRARVSDVLSYVHERLREVAFEAAESEDRTPESFVQVPWERWQNMLMLQRDLANYLRTIANPD